MPSKKSGGARAVEKKHREREAARERDPGYDARCRREYKRLGRAPKGDAVKGVRWVSDVLIVAMYQTANDPGLKPEHARELLARLAPQAMKALEPAKLMERIAELEKVSLDLRRKLKAVAAQHAGPIETRTPLPS